MGDSHGHRVLGWLRPDGSVAPASKTDGNQGTVDMGQKMSRRDFNVGATAALGALATQRAVAQPTVGGSDPGTAGLIVEKSVPIRMRDGTRLFCDIWRPDGTGKAPVLVTRTPYNRSRGPNPEAAALAHAGYAVLSQDCRGRFESEGVWAPTVVEAEDGYDTIEWAAAQPWSNGRVGMFGASYGGIVQWQAARLRPPHLVAILPETCPTSRWQTSWGAGGAYNLTTMVGFAMFVGLDEAARQKLDDPFLTDFKTAMASVKPGDILSQVAAIGPLVERLLKSRPLRDVPFFRKAAPWYGEQMGHYLPDDPFFQKEALANAYTSMDVPAIHVGGWYDVNLLDTIGCFAGMHDNAPSERTREAQRLIIGPWAHWGIDNQKVGDVDFGPDSTVDMPRLRADWFGNWLKDQPLAATPAVPVRLFVMGENKWRDEREWPLARTRYTSWYLSKEGLGPVRPKSRQDSRRYIYDPRNPVPTMGGRLLLSTGGARGGPIEQGAKPARPDVLAYTGAPLDMPLELTGPVKADIWASTDAPDTDFTVTLLNVFPDGRCYNICDGITRARLQHPIPLQKDAVYQFAVDMYATSIVIPRGNRLRVEISSSNYPMYEPNPNSGKQPGTDTYDDLRPAKQMIFHDASRPSRVVLPVIPA